jgi:hypothetical protein
MSYHIFPKSLKPIVNSGYGQTRGSNIWRSPVQGGLTRQGRNTYYDPTPISIALVVSKLGRQAFWSFIAKIDGGASSFLMELDTGNGLEMHNVQITSDIRDTTQTDVFYNIQFTATAERTSIQDQTEFSDTLVDLFGEYGDGLPAFLNYYEIYCTTPNFINNLPEPS